MTAVLTRPAHADDGEDDAADVHRQPVSPVERLAFGTLLLTTADNWTAMLFGSSDGGNAITVDTTPAAL